MGGSDNETLIVTMLSLILTLAGAGCATVVFAQTSLALRRERADEIHATTGVVPVSVGQPARRWTAIAETDSVNAQIAYLRRAVEFLHQKIGAEAAHSPRAMPTSRPMLIRCRPCSTSQTWFFKRAQRTRQQKPFRCSLLGSSLSCWGSVSGSSPPPSASHNRVQ